MLADGLMPDHLEAPAFRGETVLSQSMVPGGDQAAIPGPLKVLYGGIKSIVKNFKSSVKSKRQLIPAIVLGVIWIILIFLRLLGANTVPVNFLSFLTFAQGGLSSNPVHVVGGLIGKGVFASLVLSFFVGPNPMKSSINGLKHICNDVRA